jgi:hypothetical protein
MQGARLRHVQAEGLLLLVQLKIGGVEALASNLDKVQVRYVLHYQAAVAVRAQVQMAAVPEVHPGDVYILYRLAAFVANRYSDYKVLHSYLPPHFFEIGLIAPRRRFWRC